MTLSDLLKQHPELDLTAFAGQLGGGEEIELGEALMRIGDYARYKAEHNLDQSISVGFDSKRLIAWIMKHQAEMNEVRVYFGLDDEQKFTVVFWPYKDGVPAVAADTELTDDTLLAYNIGSRHPIF